MMKATYTCWIVTKRIGRTYICYKRYSNKYIIGPQIWKPPLWNRLFTKALIEYAAYALLQIRLNVFSMYKLVLFKN